MSEGSEEQRLSEVEVWIEIGRNVMNHLLKVRSLFVSVFCPSKSYRQVKTSRTLGNPTATRSETSRGLHPLGPVLRGVTSNFSCKSFAHFTTIALAAFVIWIAPRGANAQWMIYQSEAVAQLHCLQDQDEVVWLDKKKRRYYVRGQLRYNRGQNGVFVCRKEARISGYRRSKLGLR